MIKRIQYLVTLFLLIFVCNIFSTGTRSYLRSGEWYPKDPEKLKKVVDLLLEQAVLKVPEGKVVGLVVPHAGFEYSGRCAANAYGYLVNKDIKRVIIMGVAHRDGFYGALLTDYNYYSTPLGKIRVDMSVIRKLNRRNGFFINNGIGSDEHSVENQLPFIQRALKNKKYKIVPILFGRLNYPDFKRFAKIIGKFVDEGTAIIASTDLTHYGKAYGYVPFRENIPENLRKLDRGIIDPVISINFNEYYKYKKKTGITMCGFVPVGVLIKIMESGKCSGHLLNYYRSADLSGDFRLSVSYASIVFVKNRERGVKEFLSKKEKDELIKIAKYSITQFLRKGEIPDIEDKFSITDKMRKRSGVFVTLKKRGRLRGCIGSIIGSEPLYKGVSVNAVNSAFRDPRFSPLKKNEYKGLEFEISVMTPLKKIENYRDIKLGRDGVVLKRGYRQSVYLPQVATETGWDIDRFLYNLSLKAGLPGRAYKMKGTEFYIFQAEVFNDKDSDK